MRAIVLRPSGLPSGDMACPFLLCFAHASLPWQYSTGGRTKPRALSFLIFSGTHTHILHELGYMNTRLFLSLPKYSLFFFFKETIFFLPLHSFQVTCFSKLVDIILLHFFHTYIHSTYTNTQVRGTGAFALQKCDMPTSLQLSFNIMMWKFLQVN